MKKYINKASNIVMPFGKSGNVYLLGALGQGLSPILLTPFLSRKLDPASFGELTFVNSTSSILGILFSFGLAITISRTYVLHDESQSTIDSWFLKFVYVYIGISILLFFVNDYSIYLSILGISLIFSTLQLILPMARARNKPISFATISVFSAVLPSFFVLLNIELNNFISNIEALHLGSMLLSVISIYIVKEKHKKSLYDKKFGFLSSFRKSYFVLPHMFSIIGILNIDKLIFGLSIDKSYSGYIQIIMLIGTSPILLLGALNHAWMVQILYQLKKNKFEGIRNLNQSILKLLILSSIFALLIFIIHSQLIHFLNPNIKVNENISMSILLTMSGSGLYIIYLASTHLLLWKNKFWILSLTTPISLILQIFVIYLFIKRISYLSAALGLGLAFSFQIILLYLISLKTDHEYLIKRGYLLISLSVFWLSFIFILIFNLN